MRNRSAQRERREFALPVRGHREGTRGAHESPHAQGPEQLGLGLGLSSGRTGSVGGAASAARARWWFERMRAAVNAEM